MPEQLKPMDIEARSFEIITELLGDRKLDPENALVIKRAIHTTADFDYADNLVFSPHAVQKGIEALKAGCDIVTDTQMAQCRHQQNGAGKPRRRGPLLHVGCGRCAGGKAARRDAGVRVDGKSGEASKALHLCHRKRAHGAVLPGKPHAGGCASACADHRRSGRICKRRGEQGAAHCKLPPLRSSSRAGRKGGSNVAAAICNALLYQIRR